MSNSIPWLQNLNPKALTETLEQDLQGVALVPLDGRPDLQDLPALGEPEVRVLLEHRPHLLLQSAPFLPASHTYMPASLSHASDRRRT